NCSKQGEQTAMGWTAEQRSWVKPASVRAAERAPPPIWAAASGTVTGCPARANRMAAARPLGPEPITRARGLMSGGNVGYCRRYAEETAGQWRYGIDAHWRGRVGHGRRRLGIRLGTAGRQPVRRRYSRGARPWRELDRYGGRVWAGPFRGSGGARPCGAG